MNLLIFYKLFTRYCCFVVKEEVEDTKRVTRIRKSKKNIQHNGKMKKYNRTINDLQNIHIEQKIEKHEPH
jgi:cell fate (sporulation/competence/biofilm development) regulator YlbF (YheA/YmcA/DUF963 family)